jgi:membrane-associated phospholipid phosphatase
MNLDYNLFPSLHVGMATLSATFYSKWSKRPAALFFWLWAAAFAASTLLTRQHYIADVLGGALLGYAIGRPYAVPAERRCI